MPQKVALLILDGWGWGNQSKSDAIFNAKTPFFDASIKRFPNSKLKTYGRYVGLPEGQMGNSEVGHLNIGAGRIVYQDLEKINTAITNGSMASNQVLLDTFRQAKENNSAVHLMGLVSDGGIHSHQNHLYALCNLAQQHGLRENVFVHAFTDGRDCDPKSGKSHIQELENHIKGACGELVSVVGRYYAMDRDNRWERIKLAYDLLVHGKGLKTDSFSASIQQSYDLGVTDEFIQPIKKIDEDGKPLGLVKENDVVICFNFRTDRCREITTALTQKDFPDQEMKKIPLHYVTMTNYNRDFEGVKVLFDKENLKNTLGEVLAKNKKRQIRIAETEKYPHVTFFFSGGRETPFDGERRLLINSPKVATYDLQPEMSAEEVTSTALQEIEQNAPDFICLNYANPDMVGHTGVYTAIVQAVEKIDACVQKIVQKGLEHDYTFLIIADHGNADYAINKDGSPNTAHTTNLVPCILINAPFNTIQDGKLADIAPTILKLLNIDLPEEMTGNSLV